MKKKYFSDITVLFLASILAIVFYTMMPRSSTDEPTTLSEFSAKRALQQVEMIAKEPHFVSSKNHDVVASYLIAELQKLGLKTTVQEGFSFSDWGTLTKCKNIVARLEGSGNEKALLLLTHYDSAPHSYSKGASDAGSGVATILESIRAFIYKKKQHKNDIIILFSDAEELGLNGAALFVTQHQWAKDVGLVLNFEARGSSGPSYMLVETNAGNAGMISEFAAAKVQFPVSNSLMYSVYKMLPNDTDLTVFRKQGNIQGYNFAFIDGHYNYHTAQDNIEHVDIDALAHQGKYLTASLDYFSNANLNTLKSNDDFVYFSIPFTLITYPFSWVLPMTIIAFVLLVLLVFIGLGKRVLSIAAIVRGLIPFLGALASAMAVTFLGWQLLLILYPQYNDLLNGFTYNGQDYIVAFVALTVAICFAFYYKFSSKKTKIDHFITPLFFWILVNLLLALFLKGAGFLIIPALAGLCMLASFVITQKAIWAINLIFSIPALVLIAPLIQIFPIGLGLKVLFGSAMLTVFTFGLLLPLLGAFKRKQAMAAIFALVAIGFFAKAHFSSNYEFGKAKSNSLVYILDTDKNNALWATYDTNLDQWTEHYLGKNAHKATDLTQNIFASKYKSGFTFAEHAPLKKFPAPTIQFLKDSIANGNRYLKISITPNRNVNRYDIFASEALEFYNFKANGLAVLGQIGTKYQRKGKTVLSYYVVDQLPLEMEFTIKSTAVLDLDLAESSFDLLNHPDFEMIRRADWMMPTPFVLTDAVIVTQKIKPSVKVVRTLFKKNKHAISNTSKPIENDSLLSW